jgi:hypothetical protein
MTDEVEELREGLLREQDRVVKLSEREKYFLLTIKKAKQDFLELADIMLEKRLDPSLLDKLMKRFEQFEINV